MTKYRTPVMALFALVYGAFDLRLELMCVLTMLAVLSVLDIRQFYKAGSEQAPAFRNYQPEQWRSVR